LSQTVKRVSRCLCATPIGGSPPIAPAVV